MKLKTLKQYLSEETVPFANVKSGSFDIRDAAVRDNLNSLLAGVTSEKFVTPYIAYQRVSKVLASYHIFVPVNTFLEGDSGHLAHSINQFGPKFGQTDDGQFVINGEVRKDYTHGPHEEGEGNQLIQKPTVTEYYMYFEYRMSDCGMFNVFCEIVDEDDIEEIMTDLEAELTGETEEDLNENIGPDLSNVTMDKKTGNLATKDGRKMDFSKIKMNMNTGKLSSKV